MLAEAAAGNDLVRVWILPGGGHGALDAVDRDWTYAVYRALLRALGHLCRPSTTDEVVYSRPLDGEA